MKISTIFLVLFLSANLLLAYSGKGIGTESDPFQIERIEQLNEIINAPEAYYILANNIDASATEYWNESKGFPLIKVSGEVKFNFNEYEISNIYVWYPEFEDKVYFSKLKNFSLLQENEANSSNSTFKKKKYSHHLLFNIYDYTFVLGVSYYFLLFDNSRIGVTWNYSSKGINLEFYLRNLYLAKYNYGIGASYSKIDESIDSVTATLPIFLNYLYSSGKFLFNAKIGYAYVWASRNTSLQPGIYQDATSTYFDPYIGLSLGFRF